ncbi:histone chaperone ASF1B [Platysternon megacephalum]|uniref:Histone chaperone ASF1B n=1 Tax=Platysternon megacephalum TaxID=55544 RepID=A0A4D9EK84_9SAUR|nr:histone chaperone ASF1B [Platysternon megacephalum]
MNGPFKKITICNTCRFPSITNHTRIAKCPIWGSDQYESHRIHPPCSLDHFAASSLVAQMKGLGKPVCFKGDFIPLESRGGHRGSVLLTDFLFMASPETCAALLGHAKKTA